MAKETFTGARDWDDVDQMAGEAELFANGHGDFPEAPTEVVSLDREAAGQWAARSLMSYGVPLRMSPSDTRFSSDYYIG